MVAKDLKLLIQFPTRARPGQALYYLKHYINLLENPSQTIIHVAMDSDDESMNNEDIRELLASTLQSRVLCEGRVSFQNNKTKLDAVNRNASAFDFDIAIVGSDDLLPVVEFYDTLIKEEMVKAFPDLDGVLMLHDGTFGDLCTTPCIGRKWFDRFGWINNPIYKSVFADNDLTESARIRNKLHKVNDTWLRHNHPAHGRGNWDDLYKKNQEYWSEDQAAFNKRKEENFGVLDIG